MHEAATRGAGVVYLKKAKQFNTWIEKAPRPVFALITDWREAQPCMQVLSQHQGQNRPITMIVVCDSHRQYNRAVEWAKYLPSNLVEVHVCEKSSIPITLLAGLVRKCFACDDNHLNVEKSICMSIEDAVKHAGNSNIKEPATRVRFPCSTEEPKID